LLKNYLSARTGRHQTRAHPKFPGQQPGWSAIRIASSYSPSICLTRRLYTRIRVSARCRCATGEVGGCTINRLLTAIRAGQFPESRHDLSRVGIAHLSCFDERCVGSQTQHFVFVRRLRFI